jgi:hypothetical protein
LNHAAFCPYVSGGAGNRIQGNYIGVDRTGTNALGNTGAGIYTSGTNNSIGGDKLETLNVISGNAGAGIRVRVSSGLKIKFNNIGLGKDRADKTVDLGNTGGAIDLTNATETVTIKQTIAAYSETNAGIKDPKEKQKTTDPNLIFDNAGLGIDVGPDGVTSGLSPTLTSVVESGGTVRIQGTMQSTPTSLFLLEFFGNQVASAADAEGDLLTVVTHELGHLLGHPDLDAAVHPRDIMADSLAPGMRRLLVESRSTAASPVVERASLPPPLDASRPSAAAPPQPGRRPLPSRGSDFLLAGLNRLNPALLPATFQDSDLVHVVGRWGAADDHPRRASQEAESPRLLTPATPAAATGLEASPVGRGDPSARDWLFAHPQDAEALLEPGFPS